MRHPIPTVPDHDTLALAEEPLQQQSRCELDLVAALTAISAPVPTSERLAELRRAQWQAHLRCAREGQTADSPESFGARAQSESEAFVRARTRALAIMADPLARGHRQWAALACSGLTVLLGVAASPTPLGIATSVCVGVYLFGASNTMMAETMPTLGWRAGKMSANLECGLLDLFPVDSSQYRDYQAAYRHQLKQLYRRLGPAPWLAR